MLQRRGLIEHSSGPWVCYRRRLLGTELCGSPVLLREAGRCLPCRLGREGVGERSLLLRARGEVPERRAKARRVMVSSWTVLPGTELLARFGACTRASGRRRA